MCCVTSGRDLETHATSAGGSGEFGDTDAGPELFPPVEFALDRDEPEATVADAVGNGGREFGDRQRCHAMPRLVSRCDGAASRRAN